MSLTTLSAIVDTALAQARTDVAAQKSALVALGSVTDAKRRCRDAKALCATALVPAAAEQARMRMVTAQRSVTGFEVRKRRIKGDLASAQKAERSLYKTKNALSGEATSPPTRAGSPTRKCSVCQCTDHNRATCPSVARSLTAYVPAVGGTPKRPRSE
jgi:hypothetical protein